MQNWIQLAVVRSRHLVSGAVLLREATRSSRRWQTYAMRTGFAGTLLAALLLSIHGVIEMANQGLIDIAVLGRVGRLLFVGYAFVTMSLVATIAPLITARAVREEAEQRTLDLLMLTGLTPTQIVLGKVGSRLGVLLAMILGATPVLLLAVSMGGVSGLEVVALTVHTLTVACMGAALGGFFGLFTRSPMLSTVAAVCYGIPFYGLLPAGFALSLADPSAAALFSPLSVAAASGPTALAVPLSYLPSFGVVAWMLTRMFGLRASGAHFYEAYDATLWSLRPFLIALAVWCALALVSPLAVPLAYLDGLTNAGWASWTVGKVSGLWLWLLMTFGYALLTWVYLRVGFDIVDALDGLFGRRTGRTTADAVRVGRLPLWWRETRHGAVTIGPVLATWGLVVLGLSQTGWWLVPGGVLALGIANGAATLLLTTWLGTRSFTDERRNHTLEALVTTTLPSGSIVTEKLAAVLWPTLPLWLATGPMLAAGVPHLRLVRLYHDPSAFEWSWLFAGAMAWVWSLPVWLTVAAASMCMGLVARRPRSAMGLVVGATVVVLAPAALVGQLVPDLPVAASLARFWAPGLTGHAHLGHYVVSGALWSAMALFLTLLLTRKLRPWALRVLAVLGAIGLAGAPAQAQDGPTDLEVLHQLELDATPLLDGFVHPGGWTTVEVELRNTGAPATGQLMVEDELKGGAGARWIRDVELPAGGAKTISFPFQVRARGRDREVRFVTAGGRLATATIQLRTVDAPDVLIAVLGDDNLGLPAALRTATGSPLPRHGSDTTPSGSNDDPTHGPRKVRSSTMALRQVPTSSQVLSSVDWIVWPSADPSRLSAAQAQALTGWVVDGGHLLLTVTETGRQLEASPLAPLLPGELAPPRVEAIDDLLTAVRDRAERDRPRRTAPEDAPEPKGPVLPPSVPTPVAGLTPSQGTNVYASTPSGAPVWVGAARGAGSVHLVLADVSLDPLVGVDRAWLWRTLLWLPDHGALPQGFPREPAHRAHPEGDEELEALVRQHLADVPGLAPLPITWLGLASLVYLLLIGPVDYFVLRWTKRQVWTWVTFPTLVVGFTVVSLFALRSRKGSQAMLTRVELVDVYPEAGHWQGASHIGVFSTRKADLTVTSGARGGVLTTLTEPGFLPSPSLTAGYGPGSIAYRAETWTMAYLRSEWVRPDAGRLQLRKTDDGSLEVENRLGFDLDQLVLYEGGVPTVGFGPVRDGELASGQSDPEPIALYQEPEVWRQPPHRGCLPGDQMLVGYAPVPVDPIDLQGLAPVHRSDLVLRQQVDLDRIDKETP